MNALDTSEFKKIRLKANEFVENKVEFSIGQLRFIVHSEWTDIAKEIHIHLVVSYWIDPLFVPFSPIAASRTEKYFQHHHRTIWHLTLWKDISAGWEFYNSIRSHNTRLLPGRWIVFAADFLEFMCCPHHGFSYLML